MIIRLGELKIKEPFSLGELKLSNITVNGGGYERGYEAGYGNGYEKGKIDGYGEGVEVGRNAEWSDMWNSIQKNGSLQDYSEMFSCPSFNDVTFKPKHLIQPTAARYMFSTAQIVDGAYTDLIDFSMCRSLESMAYNSTIRKLKVVDSRQVQPSYGYFRAFGDSLEYIEEFYPTIKNYNLSQPFSDCKKLYHIKFCSEIIVDGLKLVCPNLDKESLDSVMYWLSNTTEGFSVTLPLAAVNKAFETSEGAKDGSTSAEWLALVAIKPNWTINLV